LIYVQTKYFFYIKAKNIIDYSKFLANLRKEFKEMKLALPKEDTPESSPNLSNYHDHSDMVNDQSPNWLNILIKKIKVDKTKCKPMYFRGKVLHNTNPECRPYRHS
jgi:hypothetical protein